jgi:hypothetical protein
MLIIGDARWPETAKKNLSRYGDFIPFATKNIVYDAISGHPDIFFCQHKDTLVVAPNLPEKYFRLLQEHHIPFITGKLPVGGTYPQTAAYNALVTNKYLIHNPKITDPVIREKFSTKKLIAVKQGYVRCNLFALDDDIFITSDKDIEKALRKENLEVHYFSPEGIRLSGYPNGFIGGCLGQYKKTVFIAGAIKGYPEGRNVAALLKNLGYTIKELYNGPWQDGGGILFLEK